MPVTDKVAGVGVSWRDQRQEVVCNVKEVDIIRSHFWYTSGSPRRFCQCFVEFSSLFSPWRWIGHR